MPANLTADYLAAERDYRSATSHGEKIEALERMLATVPKHKGTEKLQADLKRRLSQARKESQKKGAGHAAPIYLVKREGAGQVALVGPPNSGKSELLCSLTHARPEVGEYAFTTRVPTPGMMPYEDVQIQLVDLPPVSPEFTESWMPQLLRSADAAILVVDPSDAAVLDELEFVRRTLDSWKVAAPRLLVANKSDVPGAAADYAALEDLYAKEYQCLAVSAQTRHNLDLFARALFNLLGIVRVYTKAPGHKPDLGVPYTLRRGQTVLDAARVVHRDFAEHLKFARLYHVAGGHDGLMVERTHVIEDGDILEFHI